MKRALALAWLVCVLVSGIYLFVRFEHGLNFRTDLMALLPRDQQNPALQQAMDKATGALSRHVVLLVGSTDRAQARAAAAQMSQNLATSNEISLSGQDFAQDSIRKIGTAYFAYREGLLNDKDRQLLLDNKGEDVARRTLSRSFGTPGLINADMLHADPFLLLSDFFTGLPLPVSQMKLDDGMLTGQQDGKIWILLSGQLRHDAFTLTTQQNVANAVDKAEDAMHAAHPDTDVLKLGAVFFAKAGADQAMHETTRIGLISALGTLLLVWLVFRNWEPLLLSFLAVATGIVVAFAASLYVFGDLHVGALLFGTSLIGVAVDYSLQYCCEIFSPHPATPDQRMRNVFTAITLGASTTIIGYMTFLLAPFPGLHQIAVFSVIGIIGAWLTVVIWFPLLDRTSFTRRSDGMLRRAEVLLALWENPATRRRALMILTAVSVISLVGMGRFHVDDNIHHMQSLNPVLVEQEKKITELIGKGQDSQFFMIQAANEDMALQTEEELAARLKPLVLDSALHAFQSLAQYIPSSERQRENRHLVRERLYAPLLDRQTLQLQLSNKPALPDAAQPFLTPDIAAGQKDIFWFLSSFDIRHDSDGVTHMVMLDGVKDAPRVAAAAKDLPGVYYVDPAGDFSRLIGKYRQRALYLLILSAALMIPLLIARYRFAKGLWLMVPPGLAVLLSPALGTLAGNAFTFFDAMALVLVLSIGIDYAIFFAETTQERKAVTMLAVALAACTALLSFGLLVLSHVTAVRHFGTTMLTGITISFLLAPIARLVKSK